MTILANYYENTGCGYHRVILPMMYMPSTNGEDTIYYKKEHDVVEFAVSVCDIFYINRTSTFGFDQVMEWKKVYKFKLVVDIDDHWLLYPHHEMAEAWKKSKADVAIRQFLEAADMVTVTNERLQTAALQVNKNVHILPNGLPFNYSQFTPLRKSYDKVAFVYAGGSSHLHDLATIRGTMKRLGSDAQFRANGEIQLAGYDHSYGEGNTTSVWPKMLNVVRPAVNFSTIPKMPLHSYMRCYDHASVALAPLESSIFNACKSNLKTLEAGCKGIPIIASHTEPYLQDRDCPGVILCSTPKEWYDAMKMLLNDTELRLKLGDQLFKYVRANYDLKYISQRRYDLFKSLIQ